MNRQAVELFARAPGSTGGVHVTNEKALCFGCDLISARALRGADGSAVSLVLEERAREVDVVERVGDGPLGLGLHVGFHARHAVVRHLFRKVL